MFAFDPLHRQLPHRVLRGWKMPLIDSRFVGVITGDTKEGEQGAEVLQLRILPSANDVCEHSPGMMIDRLPHPPHCGFGPDTTPPFLHFGCTLWSDAGAAGA
jgi:hypothetical protein